MTCVENLNIPGLAEALKKGTNKRDYRVYAEIFVSNVFKDGFPLTLYGPAGYKYKHNREDLVRTITENTRERIESQVVDLSDSTQKYVDAPTGVPLLKRTNTSVWSSKEIAVFFKVMNNITSVKILKADGLQSNTTKFVWTKYPYQQIAAAYLSLLTDHESGPIELSTIPGPFKKLCGNWYNEITEVMKATGCDEEQAKNFLGAVWDILSIEFAKSPCDVAVMVLPFNLSTPEDNGSTFLDKTLMRIELDNLPNTCDKSIVFLNKDTNQLNYIGKDMKPVCISLDTPVDITLIGVSVDNKRTKLLLTKLYQDQLRNSQDNQSLVNDFISEFSAMGWEGGFKNYKKRKTKRKTKRKIKRKTKN